MRKIILRFLTFVALSAGVSLVWASAPADLDSFIAQYEPMVDRMLTGYNNEDYREFYHDFGEVMSSIATEEAFKNIYLDHYKEKYGNFQSKQLIPGMSVFNPATPLLIYQASFDNKGKVKISVNFMQEGDGYKLMQVRFDDL